MVESKLKKTIIELALKKVEEEQIANDTNLTHDLGYDSILFVELIVNLEMEFGITIDEEDLDVNQLLVYGNLLEYVKSKIEQLNALSS
jgi:Acyl carrier protein